jgi:hypothetical protein
MKLQVVSGNATDVSRGSDYSYAATAHHGPVAIKNQLVSMRLDDKPVLFRTRTLPSISDGDRVAAAGSEKDGTLDALAVRNLTTNSLYYAPTTTGLILAGLLIVIGIPLIAFLGIGLLFVGVGGWFIWKALRVRKAVGLLRAMAT